MFHPTMSLFPAVLCVLVEGGIEKPRPDATIIAAVGSQARVVTKVKVVRPDAEAGLPPPPAAVHFDKVAPSDSLSLTAGALGAGT
jgi:hypothetical protein